MLSAAPVDGYNDNAEPEVFAETGVFYHGELTNGDRGSCVNELVGWIALPDSPLYLEIIIDLERLANIAQVKAYFHITTKPLTTFQAWISKDGSSFNQIESSPRRINENEMLFSLSVSGSRAFQTRFIKVLIIMHEAGYLRCGEIEAYAEPVNITAIAWKDLKLSLAEK